MLSDVSLGEITEDLRRRARQFRPPFSTRRIIAACFRDVIVTGRELPDGIDEMVSRLPNSALIIYRRALSTAEQRIAIAHALGHLLFDMDAEEDACAIGRSGTAEVEARADRFAEKLLVPLGELGRRVRLWPTCDATEIEHEHYLDHVDTLAGLFHVPAEVIDRRIRELGGTRMRATERVLTE